MKVAFQSFTINQNVFSKILHPTRRKPQGKPVKSTVNVCGRISDGCELKVNLNGTQMTQMILFFVVR